MGKKLTKERASRKLRRPFLGLNILIWTYLIAMILIWTFATGSERDFGITTLTAVYAFCISLILMSVVSVLRKYLDL